MAVGSDAIISEAERRFPVRVRIAIPSGGFGQRLHAIFAWLDRIARDAEFVAAADQHTLLEILARIEAILQITLVPPSP